MTTSTNIPTLMPEPTFCCACNTEIDPREATRLDVFGDVYCSTCWDPLDADE